MVGRMQWEAFLLRVSRERVNMLASAEFSIVLTRKLVSTPISYISTIHDDRPRMA
jgi:hypothetical protein